MNRRKLFDTISPRVHALYVLSSLLVVAQSSALAHTLIPVANRREHVFDNLRNILYIATSQGTVDRYDVATNTLLTPFTTTAGVSLNGIDISFDNQFLYVAD